MDRPATLQEEGVPLSCAVDLSSQSSQAFTMIPMLWWAPASAQSVTASQFQSRLSGEGEQESGQPSPRYQRLICKLGCTLSGTLSSLRTEGRPDTRITWTDLEDTMLSERSKAPEDAPCVIPLL